ncbi:glutamate ABC transporter substrate-binding protein [Streptomyces phyllanthi]|uniref:Glutamate ABC transporter substrate-binding protein n=1 Tax=Streptomyces phyllanthi TaxID=1803180 RepID=A0A5N8W4C7_9ACTN|nr:glutamate ABC transporter substrate-binding protein [Streptomyces phyllanthi]MPY41736.1 glutamate ABC transporter substrate-binding protein [Streptomyces phyllanthi]
MTAARRLKASLKGWGGVGAMGVACALTAAFVLVPLREVPLTDTAATAGSGASRGAYARAEECTDPEKQSPAPSGAESGTTIAAIKKRGHLVVGVDQNSYRWGYRDPNSEDDKADLEGFDIDLAHRIADEILGDREDNIRFRAVPTNQRVPAIRDEQVDMVVRTMTISCSRLKEVAFSAPYFRTGQQVLAPKSSTIEGYDETLAEKKICTATGSTALDTLEADKEDGDLVSSAVISPPVPNQLDCLVRLQLGEVDAVVTDGALAASQAAQDPTVELKGEPFTTEYYGVAMKKEATDLVRRVNQVLEDYRASGWNDSYDKWLAPTLGEDPSTSRPPPPEYK